MTENRRLFKERPVLVAVLTVAMTAVWVTFPIGEVHNYVTQRVASIDALSPMLLRLVWLGIAVVTIPTLVLSRVPLDKYLPRLWRSALVFVIGLMTFVILFTEAHANQPAEPSMDLVLVALAMFFLVCGPAWWFNIIKPVMQRRRARARKAP